MTARRFPPPWTVEELDACFIVHDHNGQALAPGISPLMAHPGPRAMSDMSPRCAMHKVRVNFEDEPDHRAARRLAHGRWRRTSLQCRDVRYGAVTELLAC
jgi:hypothetical protein